MNASGFDPVIHAPARLQACAILSSAEEVEFALLRDALEVSDSVLSKHLRQLDGAGYVKVRKATTGGRVRTWLALTPLGAKAFATHVKALQKLASAAITR
ncbi:transcriptional regulator [Sphingomonas sp.]|uniref:transcriptional regulator n=1 Tax=Sphingomonas sp. TaxID=28214 RepID=UPI002D085366|nr:transcriptional regulator [Sphingomonas sp.]HWK36741.1 transcriptional regulator [Sphingomonas sp.]